MRSAASIRILHAIRSGRRLNRFAAGIQCLAKPVGENDFTFSARWDRICAAVHLSGVGLRCNPFFSSDGRESFNSRNRRL